MIYPILLLLTLLTCAPCAQGKYAQAQLTRVPVQRLIDNLEKALTEKLNAKDKARIQFQIGRLHSMAYAVKTETADVAGIPYSSELQVGGERIELPFYGYGRSQFHQFLVTKTTDKSKEAAAQQHLQSAVSFMQQAVQTDPTFLPARLSLAWNLEQSSRKQEAIDEYRKVMEEAWQKERSSSGGMDGNSIAVETGGYLKRLLDQNKDAREIAVIDERLKKLGDIYRAVTPIVVPTAPGVPVRQMMSERRVSFDLDGRGAGLYSVWPSKRAAWLVYRNGAEAIDSGLQMFGQNTFWVFWRDGYEALSALDDDRDGVLKGSELRGLALWQDSNYDGVCSEDEVLALQAFGIHELSCRARKHENGMPFSPGGAVFADGRQGDTIDWIVPRSKR